MQTSLAISQESTVMSQEDSSEDMPSKSLAGALKIMSSIGCVLTVGMKHGETKVYSKSKGEIMSVELKMPSMQVYPNYDQIHINK